MHSCHRLDDATLASEAWRCGLLPEGSLYLHVPSGQRFFVQRCLPDALVVWPAVELKPRVWTHDTTISRLEWVCVFNIDDYRLCPYSFTSPLHRLVVKDGTSGICAETTGEPQIVEQALVKTAFANVDEQCLEMYLTSKGKDDLVAKARSAPSTFLRNLKLQAMLHVQPDISQLEANLALTLSEELESPERGALPVPADLVHELVHPTEAKEIVAYELETKHVELQKTADTHERHTRVKASIKKALPKAAPKKLSQKAKNIEIWAAIKNPTAQESLEHVLKFGPPSEYIKIHLDERQGRLKMTSKTDAWTKSFSWTKRGLPKCTNETIHAGWKKFNRMTGLPMPNNIEDLPRFFQDDDVAA